MKSMTMKTRHHKTDDDWLKIAKRWVEVEEGDGYCTMKAFARAWGVGAERLGKWVKAYKSQRKKAQ